jgi:hypothetical protein
MLAQLAQPPFRTDFDANGDSELMDGDGLTTTPYVPQPGTEITSPVDSTPVGVDIGQRGPSQKEQRAAQSKDASKRNKEKLAS